MMRVYVSRGKDAIDDETFKHAGIKELRKIAQETKPPENLVCGHCNTANPLGNDYCFKCGHGLSDTALADQKDDQSEAMKVYADVIQRMVNEEVQRQVNAAKVR
jgi:ribosomal protein L40E